MADTQDAVAADVEQSAVGIDRAAGGVSRPKPIWHDCPGKVSYPGGYVTKPARLRWGEHEACPHCHEIRPDLRSYPPDIPPHYQGISCFLSALEQLTTTSANANPRALLSACLTAQPWLEEAIRHLQPFVTD